MIAAALALAQAASAVIPAEWITLGTAGGPAVQAERAQIANALVVGDAVYLFDTGNDVQRQLAGAGIAERRVRAVFLSHHHLDHNADLGPVIMAHWTFGHGVLHVFGPAGTRTLVDGLVAANAPTVLAAYPTHGEGPPPLAETVEATEIAAAGEHAVQVYADEHLRVSAILADHYQTAPSVVLPRMPEAVAYRVEAGGKTIVYTGDSGPSANVAQLAAGADLLVSEIVDVEAIAERIARDVPAMPAQAREALVHGMRVNHLTADEVGRLASRAGVKAPVLTHFVPVPEQMAEPPGLATEIRRRYQGPVTLARDLDRFAP